VLASCCLKQNFGREKEILPFLITADLGVGGGLCYGVVGRLRDPPIPLLLMRKLLFKFLKPHLQKLKLHDSYLF
jgi:hypothetical protein